MVLLEERRNNIPRLDYVDVARGLGIILVVCSHSVFPNMMYWANLCFVPLFFVLSGYTINKVDLKKKALRLLKPYFFFNILIVGLMWGSQLRTITFIHILGVFYSRFALYPQSGNDGNIVFMNVGNSPTWFLTSMFVAFIMLAILLKVVKRRWMVLLGYLGLTFALNQLPILLPWSWDISFLMALFLYSGMIIRERRIMAIPFKYVALCVLLYALVAYFNGYCNISIRNFGNSLFLYFIGAVLGSFLLMRLAKILDRTCLRKMLIGVGQNSLVIFCIQIPLLFMGEKMFSPIAHYLPEAIRLGGVATLQVLLALCLGYGLSRFINKYIPYLVK